MAITDAQRMSSGTTILRYPETLTGEGVPFVTFSTHKPVYADAGDTVNIRPSGNSVSLYIPTGYTVSDSISYENQSEGAIIGMIAEGMGGANFTGGDLVEVGKNYSEQALTALTSAGVGAIAGGPGAILGAVTGGNASIQGHIDRSRGKTLNPREYMLFKSPEMRSFPFSFTMFPQSESEAKMVPQIIRFFRRAAYPTTVTNGIQYAFPEAFRITFGGTDSLIKIPEVVCNSVEVSYNPNSMSYFRYNNMPVETTLNLTFQELKPIDRAAVEQGY